MLQIVTRILLGSYFISRGVLADTVPKAVMRAVSRGSRLQQHLSSRASLNLVPSLLMEHPETEAAMAPAKLSAGSLRAPWGPCPRIRRGNGAEAVTRLCMINMIASKTTARRDETSLIAIARGASPRVPRTRASR